MSQNRRPSPIQPPPVTNPPDDMAQVQRRPEFPMPSFHTRPQSDLSPGIALPGIHAVQAGEQLSHGQLRLPPIQLPPISDSRPPRSSDVFSITSLLSRNPDPPRERTLPPRMTAQQRPQLPMQSSPRSIPESHGGVRTHIPSAVRDSQHYLDEPPVTVRSPASFMQAQQHPPPQLRYGASIFDGEQPHHSPATSVLSYGRGPYSSSTEPSPIAPAAPPIVFPIQQRVSKPPPLDYNLIIRQQPAAARACGFGERDRRVIDPPPILELKITDQATGSPEQDLNAMLALHCTLLSHDGKEDETEVPPTEKGMPTTRRLMGTLVASPYQAKDEHGVGGTFFVFPDLSCRSPGKYRLRFKLLRVDPTNMTPGAVHGSVASIVTDVFSVFTAKDFPGMRASSALLKALRRQGLNVGVKKGSEARKGRTKTKKESSSEDEDDDHSEADELERRRGSDLSVGSETTEDMSPRSKPRKKGKRRKREA